MNVAVRPPPVILIGPKVPSGCLEQLNWSPLPSAGRTAANVHHMAAVAAAAGREAFILDLLEKEKQFGEGYRIYI